MPLTLNAPPCELRLPTAAPADDLLPRIARGEQPAVADCIGRYGGLVWSLVSRMLGTGPEAEDVTQEVFIALWEKAAVFDPSAGSEATFIAVIARRRCIDRLRQRTRRPAPDALPDAVPDPSPQPGYGAEVDDEVRVAQEAMETLPEAQRDVLKLTVCDGLTQTQAAERLQLPLGTVKSHARRGLARLRDTLHASREVQP